MRRRVGAAVTAALCLCSGAMLAGQQGGPGDAPVFRSKVELVTVDVGVVDSQGQPVRGLTAPDFTVTVGGEPRRIVTAEFIDAAAAPGARAGRQAPLAPVSSNEGAGVGRMFVFIVDEDTIQAGQFRQVAEAASRLLGRLSVADRSALMRLPNGPNVNFTWAHDRVDEALRSVVGASASSFDSEFGSLSVARDIVNGRFRGLDGLESQCGMSAGASPGAPPAPGPATGAPGAPGSGQPGGSGGASTGATAPSPGGGFGAMGGGLADDCARDLKRRAEWTWRNAQMTSLSSLTGLRNALGTLARVPGDKTVILISGGWPLDEAEETSLIAQAAADAAAARATIFSLFVPATQIAAMRQVVRPTPVDDQWLYTRPLENLAAMTGGQSHRLYVGAEPAFDRVARETAAYYRIGVEKSLGDGDGKPRRLKVRVSRSGATVRAREVFDARTYEDRNWTARLASALESPLVATGIGLRVTSYVTADPDNSARLQLHLTGEALRVGPGEATIRVLVRDQQGKGVVSSDQLVGQPTDEGLAFSARLPLAPGSYVARVALMDGDGRTGSVDHFVDVREEPLGELRATGPILIRVPVDPQRQPRLTLTETRQDERLAIQVQLAGQDARLADADVTFEIAAAGDGRSLIEPVAVVPSRSRSGWVDVQGVVDLRLLPPGPYVVRARVSAGEQPLGELIRTFAVAGRAPASPEAEAALAVATTGTRPAPPRQFHALALAAPRFAVSATLAPPVLAPFLDRVAARPDAGAPAIRDLIDRARAAGVEQLAIPDGLAADQPVAAFLEGLTLLGRNELDPAARAFRGAMRLAPDLYPAMFYLGACYAAGGRDKDAAAAWRTALIKEGDNPVIHLLLTDALLRQQQVESALGIVDAARRRWPTDDALKRRFVVAALSAGRYADGLQVLDELVDTHADDEPTLVAGLLVLYESFEGGRPVEGIEEDRARMARLADAYRGLGGPSVALVDTWVEAARKR